MESESLIYLDNNATTPVDPRVLEVMIPYFSQFYGNASSTHVWGSKAYEAVKKARAQVAELIGAETNEVIFTSGATEAINLAIKGVAEQYSTKGKHIITVSTEHSAVLDTCKYLETRGFEVAYLPVQHDGLLDVNVLKNNLRSDTILVIVMLANNETGVIHPIKEIAELSHGVGALFMSDATQAVGKIAVNVDELGIDLLCLSGHKLYAPKGVGALYVRQRMNRVKIPALFHGGGHERGLRSGTLNVPGIVGLGEACAIAASEMKENEAKIKPLRDLLELELIQIKGSSVNGHTNRRLFNVSNMRFNGVDADSLVVKLSAYSPTIAVSSGSACSSAVIEPSHVLLAMGIGYEEAGSALRFSLGKQNSKDDIAITVEAVKNCLRSVVPV